MHSFKQGAFALVIATSMLLAGCGSKEIQSVKNTTVYEHPSYTYGQLLDNRKICADVKWSKFKDDHQRLIVQYDCTYKYDKAPYLSHRDFMVRMAQAQYDRLAKQCNEQIKEGQNVNCKAYLDPYLEPIKEAKETPYIAHAKETIQWSPTDHGYELAYGGLTITMSNGDIQHYGFDDYGQAFGAMLNHDANTAHSFIGRIFTTQEASN